MMRVARPITALVLLFKLLCTVRGDYQLSVTVYSYSNPDNKCAVCRDSPREEFGCCDNHVVKDAARCSVVQTRECDILLSVCLRDEVMSGDVGAQCPTGSTIYSSNTVEGPAFNPPLVISRTGTVWDSSQLYVVLNDDDFEIPQIIELVDSFAINLTVGTTTPSTIYTGQFGLATIDISFSLVCLPNFYGPDCARFCDSNCVCDPGFTGEFCQTNINDCLSVDCSGRGQCVDGVNSYTCDCDPGYTGSQCQLQQEQITGAVVGVVVGGLVLLIIIVTMVIVVVVCVKRQRNTSKFIVNTPDTTEENVYQQNIGYEEKEFDNPMYGDLKDELS